jgi:hypothetical protein
MFTGGGPGLALVGPKSALDLVSGIEAEVVPAVDDIFISPVGLELGELEAATEALAPSLDRWLRCQMVAPAATMTKISPSSRKDFFKFTPRT